MLLFRVLADSAPQTLSPTLADGMAACQDSKTATGARKELKQRNKLYVRARMAPWQMNE